MADKEIEEFRYEWRDSTDRGGDEIPTYTATTDEKNMLRIHQFQSGFWGVMVNGTDVHDIEEDEPRFDHGPRAFGDPVNAIRFAEKHGDAIAQQQIDNEK